jgi:hypothetical protein
MLLPMSNRKLPSGFALSESVTVCGEQPFLDGLSAGSVEGSAETLPSSKPVPIRYLTVKLKTMVDVSFNVIVYVYFVPALRLFVLMLKIHC